MKHRLIVSLLFVSLLFTVSAFAENLLINVPFDFTAGKTLLHAGKYNISWETRVPDAVVVRDPAGKTVGSLPVITTLANRSNPGASACIVFDDVNGKKSLSEVWFPGTDGLLVSAATEKHTHQIIKPQ